MSKRDEILSMFDKEISVQDVIKRGYNSSYVKRLFREYITDRDRTVIQTLSENNKIENDLGNAEKFIELLRKNIDLVKGVDIEIKVVFNTSK